MVQNTKDLKLHKYHCLPCLKEIFRPVCRLQSKHMLLFSIVCSFSGKSMVDTYCIVGALHKMALLQLMLILELIKNHVSQHSIQHFPASFSKGSCNKISNTNSANSPTTKFCKQNQRYQLKQCSYHILLQIKSMVPSQLINL